MVEVDYNKKNLERCMCISCPVQMDSVCANGRRLKLLDTLNNMNEGDMMPEPSHIAGIYCAIGKATCGDLATEKMCQCTKCPVFKENNLTTGYYCNLGIED